MIDIVITNRQILDPDGLSLVRSINETHRDIPSIWVTTQGSESTPSGALQEGATGYVPKKELAQKLVETIQNVWALMQSERFCRRLPQPP